MCSKPAPKLAISLSPGPAWASRAASIRSVTVGASTSARARAEASASDDMGESPRVQLDVEQLTHPRLDRVGQFACDNDFELAIGHGGEGKERVTTLGARVCSKALRAGQWSALLLALAGLPLSACSKHDSGADAVVQPGGRQTPSGFPVPRYVSLKFDKVNARGGPR